VHTQDEVFTIRFLSPTEDKDKHGRTIYRYEDDTYEIDDDSVTHYLETDIEEDIGFKAIDESGWVRENDDPDDEWVPSDEDEDENEDEDDEEEDESLVDSLEDDYDDDDGGDSGGDYSD
jgi:hypothetical protein